LQQELTELKLGRDVPQPMVVDVEQGKVVSRRRRGRGTCRGRPGPIKQIRQSTARGRDMTWHSSSSGDENTTLRRIDGKYQKPEPKEKNGLNGVNVSDNVVADAEETISIPESPTTPVSQIVPVSTDAVNVPVDPRYLADTQIDSPDGSPTWLQQSLKVLPTPLLQPSINHNGEHQKMSVLDDLWSGIL